MRFNFTTRKDWRPVTRLALTFNDDAIVRWGKNVLVGHAKDTFEKAMSIMTENHIRHLPIMDGHNVIGMLSLGDVAKEMIVYQRNLIKELESYVKQ